MQNLILTFKKNLLSWEARTPIHLRSKFYDNEFFLKEQNSLKGIELQALGVNNQHLLHLQCHLDKTLYRGQKKGQK